MQMGFGYREVMGMSYSQLLWYITAANGNGGNPEQTTVRKGTAADMRKFIG